MQSSSHAEIHKQVTVSVAVVLCLGAIPESGLPSFILQ